MYILYICLFTCKAFPKVNCTDAFSPSHRRCWNWRWRWECLIIHPFPPCSETNPRPSVTVLSQHLKMKTNTIRKRDKYFSKFIQTYFVHIEIEGGRVACSVFTLFFPAWPRMLVIYVTYLIPQHLKIKKKNRFWNLDKYIQKIIQILFCR